LPVLRTGVGNEDAAELVLNEAAAEDGGLELDPILDELEVEDDGEV
jgi:hypothetical protein